MSNSECKRLAASLSKKLLETVGLVSRVINKGVVHFVVRRLLYIERDLILLTKSLRCHS